MWEESGCKLGLNSLLFSLGHSGQKSGTHRELNFFTGFTTDHTDSPGGRVGSAGSSGHLGQSVFDYIEKLSGRSSVFHNFLYTPDRTSDSTVRTIVFAWFYSSISVSVC